MYRLALGSALAFLAASTASGAQPLPTPTPVLKPEAIYLRAVAAMKAEPQPAYVIFREDVDARNVRITCTAKGASASLHHGDVRVAYRVWFRVRDSASVTQDLATKSICNETFLRPTGDATSTPTQAPSPAATSSDAIPKEPALIGSIKVETSRYYRIELASRKTFDGHDVYRLSLHACRKPNIHPLNEVLVARLRATISLRAGEPREASRTIASARGSEFAFVDALPEIAFPKPAPTKTPNPS